MYDGLPRVMVSDQPAAPDVTVLAFSYDRPLQAWGLVRSLLDLSDVDPERIIVIAKSTSDRFRAGYDMVSRELGCRIYHEVDAPPGWRRRLNRNSLYDSIIRLSEGSGYVSLAVDDMMYFRETRFAAGISNLESDPDLCLWSWRIGADLQPDPCLELRADHWRADRRQSPMPYQYCFHCDGSLFRRRDLLTWLDLLPRLGRRALNLNGIESRLSRYRKPKRAGLVNVGRYHAGPRQQTCITWQVNKVVEGGSAHWSDLDATKTDLLQDRFDAGERLDFRPLCDRNDWLMSLNADWPHAPTHVAPTAAAADVWLGCLRRPD